MPNQQEHQTAHSERYYLSFPDGSLSKKLLDFAYKDEKKWTDELLATQIAQKIYKLPEGSSPHYYQGKQTLSDFGDYVATDDGKKIISKIREELDICFKQLSTWAKAQKLEVTDEHITQGVDAELLDFFNRLVDGYYSDRSILFYADGKKSIEALTVLIQDESIDLAFRQNQLISIATEGNLQQCAEGCFSRFTSAAESIKNYGDFSTASLVKKFVRSLAEEIVNSPFIARTSYAEALCEKSALPTESYEIHAQNVLINGLLKELNLESLGIKDTYTHSFENSENEFTRKIHQRFVQIFKSEFTSNRLVKFIIDQYYQAQNIQFTAGKFSGSEEFDIPALEGFLKGLGLDDDFKLHEVLTFDDRENVSLKDDKVLAITLLERLYNNGLLDAGNFRWILRFKSLHEAFKKYDINFLPIFKGTFSQDYRVVPANIELTWLKDQSGNRILLRDCFKHIKNCFAILKERLPSEQVGSLLINVNDLIIFFDMLPREQHSAALSWMRENEVALDGVMLNQRLFDEKMNIDGPFPHSFYLEGHNKLLTVINEQALPELIKQLNSHKSIDKLLTDTFDLINEAESFDFLISDILVFIRLIQQGGFKNFKDLKFGEMFLEQGDCEKEVYNKGIDFSNSNLQNIEFEKVLNSKFKGATLINLNIKSSVLNTDFKESKGTIEIFGDVSNTDFSRSRLTADIKGEIKDSFFHKLTGNLRIDGNIHNSDVTNFKGNFKLNGKVIKTGFKDFDGAMEINGVLSDSSFEKAHGASLEINGELGGCNLHAIQFEKIKVTGKISNSYLTSIDFTDTIFIDRDSKTELANSDKVFKVQFAFDNNKETKEDFFKKSKFSTNSLTQFLELPSWEFLAGNRPFPLLRGTDLSRVEFQDPKLRAVLKKFYLLDFIEANLPYSNFDHFLQNEAPGLYQYNFENANLKGSTFDGANLFNCYLQGADLSDCDLSTANIQSSCVKGAKIDNLKLNCEQLLHFYEQGHRDFSSLRLVGTLENVEITSLAGTKLSSQVFEHLIEHGFKNFKEVDLMAVSPEIFSKYDRHELSFDDKTIRPPYAPSVTGCVKKKRLNKRHITCLISSDDLESFNAETNEPPNLEKIKIDSERFLAVAKSASAEKQAQLIELASMQPIVGQKKAEVEKLKKVRQWQIHLNKVGQVAGLMSKGLMLKDTLASFLNGDYTDTAINLGFLGGGSFLAQFSKEMEAKGAAYLLERKTLLGNGLKLASPFVSRATSAYMVYDLVQGIKALNSGDKDAVVRVVGDSIYIGVDITEIGIETAEVFEIFEGVSAITGPVGEVIGAVVFLGTDIYQAVERVKHIDEMIHLTGGEKFREGVRAFLGMSMEGSLEELLQIKQFNEAVIKQKWEFLKQHPTIKNYLFPTEKQVCHKESYLEGEKWSGGKPRRRLVEVCDQTEPDLDNQIFLGRPKEQRTFGHEKPEVPGDLLCFPAGSGGSTGLSYSCENAIGIADPSPKAGNYTLINVGAGEDKVQGFPDSPNIIVAGNGDKHLIGGNQDDTFILQGDVISGSVDGKAGVNTLDLGEFAPNRGSLQINLGEQDPYLAHEGYGFEALRLWRVQQVLARKDRSETIHVGCNTRFVDGKGGCHSNRQDVIMIGNNQMCNYQMQMKVAPYTLIKNQASQGNFSYLITRESGEAEIHFEPLGRDTTQHQISFNYTLAEIEQLRFLSDNKVVFNLMPEAENGFNVTLSRSNSTKISCVFTDAEMKLGDKRTYTLHQTKKTPAEIVRQGPAIATKLQGSIVIQAQHQQAKSQTVVIGYPLHHDVLQNDPVHPTHLLGNGGENIYKIMPRVGNKKIPRITLHPSQAKEKQVETLDLRAVIQQLEAHDYCTSRLMIRKKGKNLQLSINVTANKKCKLSKKPILHIILKDAAKTHWANQLNIIMHQSFLEIVKTKNKGSRNAWILVPKPLVFDKTKKIIILSAQDIEANTRVILPQAPGGLNFARIENSDDLVITSKRINQARTVVIKEFYSAQGHDAHKLITLSLEFGNNTVNLTDVASQSLPSLTTLQNNKKEQIYNSIFGESLDATIIQRGTGNGMLAGLVFVPVVVVYLVRRHVQGRQFRPHVVEAATALLTAASLPHQTDAKPIISKTTETTEMVACHNKLLEDKHCAKSKISIGALIFCATNERGFAWFKGENGYDSAYALFNSTRLDAFELRTFGENLLIARGENGCQQFINLKEMHEIPADVMTAQPIFKELLKQPLEQYRKQNNPIERFKQQAQQISLIYLGEQCLVHTRLGDSFRVLGLTPNWQQRDAGHWSSRMLRSLSMHNLFSSASISAVCLETALLHPRVQSALPQEEVYRGKLVIRFIADLLQFGPAASSCIPALVDFLCYQHPWSYELAMGLRGFFVMLDVIHEPSAWYLAVSLFILPHLPYLFEKIGIPVTPFINHALQMLERFLIPYSLMLSVQEDPQRLEAKEIALQEAQQRVSQGQEQVVSVYNSGVGFFSKPKVSEEKTNDVEFSHGTSPQFAAKN